MMSGLAVASIARDHSQAHTSATLAAQATSSATVSVSWTRSQELWRIVRMAGNIRRFWPESLGDSFLPDLPLVKDSGTPQKRAETGEFCPIWAIKYWPTYQPACNPDEASALTLFTGASYALRAVL